MLLGAALAERVSFLARRLATGRAELATFRPFCPRCAPYPLRRLGYCPCPKFAQSWLPTPQLSTLTWQHTLIKH